MHQTLDDVGCFRPSCAAVCIDWCGVGKRCGDLAIDRWSCVLTGKQRRIENRWNAGREGRQVRTHRRGRVNAHRQELPIRIERKLGMGHMVAPVGVGQEGFAALRRPFDRTIDALARPYHRGLFRVQIDLRTESSADVRRDHAHLGLGQTENERCHQQSLDVRILARDVERIAVVGAAVACDRGSRLDCIGDEPVIDDVQLRDVRRLGECRVHRRLVAQRPRVALVAGSAIVDLRSACLQRFDRIHHCGHRVVIDVDQLGGVFRLGGRLRNDHRQAVSNVAYLALSKHRMRRFLHGLTVCSGDEPATGQAVDAGQVSTGVDRDNSGCGFRFGGVDPSNIRVSVRRA